jgi:hypothetical protein
MSSNTGKLWHTIRESNGNWQSGFDDVEDVDVGQNPGRFVAVGCENAGSLLHVCGVTDDGQLYHTFRDSGGFWQRPFDNVKAAMGQDPGRFVGVGCAGIYPPGSSDPYTQILAVTDDGKLWHTYRKDADGSWQNGFGDVKASVGDPGHIVAVGCTRGFPQDSDVDAELHVFVVTNDGKLWNTIRHADGSWLHGFGDVKASVGDPGHIVAVSCGQRFAGGIQVCAVTDDGKLWHTIRYADGSWAQGFGDVKASVGDPGHIVAVGCAEVLQDANDSAELAVLVVTDDGKLWHTYRKDADGSWQHGFGDVKASVGGAPPSVHLARAVVQAGVLCKVVERSCKFFASPISSLGQEREAD